MAGLASAAFSWAPLARAELPPGVLAGLKAAGVPASSVSVVVQDVEGGRPRLEHLPAEPRNPASTMKLVTTLAALELLGPAYRWKTEVFQDGANLALRGTGDPKLNVESFWALLRNLRARGLQDIAGDILLDRSHFGPVADGRVDNEAFRPYNVAPDALLVNFKSLRFLFVPEPERRAVRVFADPGLPGLEIVNTLRITEGACAEGRAFRDMVQAQFRAAPARAAFTGSYPSSCGERELNVALHEPEDFLAAMIRRFWGELGGSWTGTTRSGPVPPGARLLYVHESPPLAEVVRDINKVSNNVMARQLYLTLGAESAGPPARAEASFQAVRKWLGAKRIAAPELVIENGSGLSRAERISASSMAAMLQAGWRSPRMPEFIGSMPVVGVDGTMRRRLPNDPVAGRAHIKTGLLSDVRAMAGYVLDQKGRRLVVVMFVNHASAHEAQAAMDTLLRWVHAG